jgi:hypothetical protein
VFRCISLCQFTGRSKPSNRRRSQDGEAGSASDTVDPCGIRQPLFGRLAPLSFRSNRVWACKHK